jgi:hypothetical protein
MSIVNYNGWSELHFASSVTLVPFQSGVSNSFQDEADQIPDWAAIAVALGAIIAFGGFFAAWLSDSGWATLVLTAGLVLMAIGMRTAERAIDIRPQWRPLGNA